MRVDVSDAPSLAQYAGCVGVVESFSNGRFLVLIPGEGGNDGVRIRVPSCKLAPVADADDAYRAGDRIPAPARIGNEAVDCEHDSIVECINALLAAVDMDANGKAECSLLRNAIDAMATHFAHEEALAKAAGYGEAASGFSALTGHVTDHQRILALGEKTMAVAAQRTYATAQDALAVANAFRTHAQNYDTLLEPFLCH